MSVLFGANDNCSAGGPARPGPGLNCSGRRRDVAGEAGAPNGDRQW